MLPQVTHQSNDSVDVRGGERQGSTENTTESASEQVRGRWGAVAQALSPEAEPVTTWLPRWLSGKELAWHCRRRGFDPWVRKIPWRRKWQPTPVFLPGKSHGQRSLAGYSPWGHKEPDTTEKLNSKAEHRGTGLGRSDL